MSDGVFDNPLPLNHREPAAPVSFDEFRKVVESRRSVRVYRKDEVPDTVVEECLRLALLAPNSSNLQPWEFHWVKNQTMKTKLVEACLSQPAARTAPTLIVCVARTKTWKKHAAMMVEQLKKNPATPKAVFLYYTRLVHWAYSLGPLGLFGLGRCLIMWAVGFFRPAIREPHTLSKLQTWAIKSTALACENLMLAFRAAGYDSCPMEGCDTRRIKKLLKLPRDAQVVMVVSAGKRAENGVYGTRIRFEKERFIFKYE